MGSSCGFATNSEISPEHVFWMAKVATVAFVFDLWRLCRARCIGGDSSVWVIPMVIWIETTLPSVGVFSSTTYLAAGPRVLLHVYNECEAKDGVTVA